MNMSIEKKKYSSPLPTNWRPREETQRKPSHNQHIQSTGKVDAYYYSRGNTILPPIRQTASIFKQPVTIYKLQSEGMVNKELKTSPQDKPKQLFWEKRLEGLRACDPDGFEIGKMELPKSLKPVGPNITEETVLQSVATALHLSTQPVTGQQGPKSALERNPGVFLNPDQPLIQAVTITEEDIRKQEERVITARKKLQEALRALYT